MGFFTEIGKHVFGIRCSVCKNRWAGMKELKGILRTPPGCNWSLEIRAEIVVSYAQVASSFFAKVVGFDRMRNVRIATQHLFGIYGCLTVHLPTVREFRIYTGRKQGRCSFYSLLPPARHAPVVSLRGRASGSWGEDEARQDALGTKRICRAMSRD